MQLSHEFRLSIEQGPAYLGHETPFSSTFFSLASQGSVIPCKVALEAFCSDLTVDMKYLTFFRCFGGV